MVVQPDGFYLYVLSVVEIACASVLHKTKERAGKKNKLVNEIKVFFLIN